jgi:hypothetical protein
MPTDQETLEIAYYIRDLVNASAETKELANFFFEMLRTEQAITMRELGDGFKLVNVRDADGNIVDREKVLFSEQDYQRRSGIIEGLGWLEDEVKFRIKQANDEDKRKAEEKEEK